MHEPSGRLGTYMPADGEISPEHVSKGFGDLGWTIWIPVVGQANEMLFARIGPDDPLQHNRFGIVEPVEPRELVRATDLDIIIVPCVALDRQGNRLGMGAGFYDRALGPPNTSRERLSLDGNGRHRDGVHRPPVLIGVGFEVQLVEALPTNPWDVPMDIVVTEDRCIVVNG